MSTRRYKLVIKTVELFQLLLLRFPRRKSLLIVKFTIFTLQSFLGLANLSPFGRERGALSITGTNPRCKVVSLSFSSHEHGCFFFVECRQLRCGTNIFEVYIMNVIRQVPNKSGDSTFPPAYWRGCHLREIDQP